MSDQCIIVAAVGTFRRSLRVNNAASAKEFETRMEEYAAATQRFLALREQYLKDNNLSTEK